MLIIRIKRMFRVYGTHRHYNYVYGCRWKRDDGDTDVEEGGEGRLAKRQT